MKNARITISFFNNNFDSYLSTFINLYQPCQPCQPYQPYQPYQPCQPVNQL